MTFSTQQLVNDRVVVQGEDIFGNSGSTVLDASQWNHYSGHTAFNRATEAFDAAVSEFFAPLEAATEELNEASKPQAKDPSAYLVLEEEVLGVKPKAGILVELHTHSIILRLLEEGDTDRLVWVDGELEVLAFGS